MRTKTKPRLPVKQSFTQSFVSYTAQCIAEREQRQDEQFSGQCHGPDGGTAKAECQRMPSFGAPLVRCCAYTEAGNICGVSPAPFLDFQRGGFVCAEHKPERGNE